MHELASCFCPYQLYPHDTLCTYGVKQLRLQDFLFIKNHAAGQGEPRPAPHILIFSVMPGKMDAHDRRYSMRARYAIAWR